MNHCNIHKEENVTYSDVSMFDCMGVYIESSELATDTPEMVHIHEMEGGGAGGRDG